MDKTGEPNAENENAVRLLIENGCRIDLQTDSYQEFFQNLTSLSKKLFSNVDFGLKTTNFRNLEKETPLHMAARYARADAAKQFLQCGADPNIKDIKGRTPLHAAIASDSYGVFTIILNDRNGFFTASRKP